MKDALKYLGFRLAVTWASQRSEGDSKGCSLGIPDSVRFSEGWLLGLNDGCDVGQSETEGLSEGRLLGAELINCNSDGIADEGQSVTDGSSLGTELGLDEGSVHGRPEILGLLFRTDDGWPLTELVLEGNVLGMLEIEGHREG